MAFYPESVTESLEQTSTVTPQAANLALQKAAGKQLVDLAKRRVRASQPVESEGLR